MQNSPLEYNKNRCPWKDRILEVWEIVIVTISGISEYLRIKTSK